MSSLLYFLSWTLLIYCMHVAVHEYNIPYVRQWHNDHHKQVTLNKVVGWHWNNLFLFNDTWKSTFDLWFTEVIPTLLFCFLTQQWWLFIVYYLWAAFIQEAIEHNKNFNIYPFLTSGKWHLIHHVHPKCNYGVFFPIWDIIFHTNVKEMK